MNQESGGNLDISKHISRDYLFDNLKAILIILVVWGHLLTSMLDQLSALKSIYIFIYFFHMPAMVIVSGYFSKNIEKIKNNAFTTLFIPYLILSIINAIYELLVLKKPYHGFRIFNPSWGLWYLLVLFFWRYFLKDLIKIRLLLPFSFLFAIVSGYSNEFSAYMELGRTFCFLPFFLLGFYCNKDHVNKIRRIPKIISVGIITATVFLSKYLLTKNIIRIEDLYLRSPYPEGSESKAMIARILVYVIAVAMSIAIVNLMTAKKNFLSTIGTSTMTVYILHLFIVPILEKYQIFKTRPYLYLWYSALTTAAIVFFFSRPEVVKRYNKFMGRLSGLIMKNNEINK